MVNEINVIKASDNLSFFNSSLINSYLKMSCHDEVPDNHISKSIFEKKDYKIKFVWFQDFRKGQYEIALICTWKKINATLQKIIFDSNSSISFIVHFPEIRWNRSLFFYRIFRKLWQISFNILKLLFQWLLFFPKLTLSVACLCGLTPWGHTPPLNDSWKR